MVVSLLFLAARATKSALVRTAHTPRLDQQGPHETSVRPLLVSETSLFSLCNDF